MSHIPPDALTLAAWMQATTEPIVFVFTRSDYARRIAKNRARLEAADIRVTWH